MVAFARYRAGKRKTGHAGTLDPLATGVLLLAIGNATKSIERLMATSKRYETTIDLSAFSPSDDLETDPVPVADVVLPGLDRIRAVLDDHFTGTIMQRPPLYSALRIDGRRAYTHARAGADMTLERRPATVHAITILEYDVPRLTLDVHCAKGFYIHSLARELGEALGTGGHCTAIQRTAVGPFTIDQARSPEDIGDVITQDMLIPIDALDDLLRDERA